MFNKVQRYTVYFIWKLLYTFRVVPPIIRSANNCIYSLFFFISNSIHYSLPSTYSICYPLSFTCFRPHRPIIRRSKLYMQPVVLSPSERCLCRAAVSQRPHDKDICRGGEYHRLHVQFRPPDDGPVSPETCRGKRIADTVCRRKRIMYRVGNKEKSIILRCTVNKISRFISTASGICHTIMDRVKFTDSLFNP